MTNIFNATLDLSKLQRSVCTRFTLYTRNRFFLKNFQDGYYLLQLSNMCLHK